VQVSRDWFWPTFTKKFYAIAAALHVTYVSPQRSPRSSIWSCRRMTVHGEGCDKCMAFVIALARQVPTMVARQARDGV